MFGIKVHVSISILVVTLLLLGCANRGNPIMPGQAVSRPTEHSGGSNHQLWGIWHVQVDPSTMAVNAVPIRGAMFTCNVTRFMQPPKAPVNYINWILQPGSKPLENYFVIRVSLTHPFPGWHITKASMCAAFRWRTDRL